VDVAEGSMGLTTMEEGVVVVEEGIVEVMEEGVVEMEGVVATQEMVAVVRTVEDAVFPAVVLVVTGMEIVVEMLGVVVGEVASSNVEDLGAGSVGLGATVVLSLRVEFEEVDEDELAEDEDVVTQVDDEQVDGAEETEEADVVGFFNNC